MTTAVYPGGFDPVTNGHLDIISRASGLFDQLVVGVYRRPQELFTLQERQALLQEAARPFPNVSVSVFEGLVVDFARTTGATVLVRGIRAVTGFEAEFDMALMNKKMAPELESVYLMASLEHLYISASRIRELAGLGHPVNDLVPAHVADALATKLGPVHAG
jgi:pantetheine-phosphate adenylyltransferase